MNEQQLKILTEVEQRSKSNTHRIDNLEEQNKLLYEMNTNIRLIAQESKGTTEKVNKIEKDIDDIKQKPNKRLDIAITATITSIVTLIVTNFLR